MKVEVRYQSRGGNTKSVATFSTGGYISATDKIAGIVKTKERYYDKQSINFWSE